MTRLSTDCRAVVESLPRVFLGKLLKQRFKSDCEDVSGSLIFFYLFKIIFLFFSNDYVCKFFSIAKASNVVSNIPPGVTPVMSTPYIMGQGIPYFQQPIYSYEEMQLIQQRIPHMVCYCFVSLYSFR